jgi:hypothetical protein
MAQTNIRSNAANANNSRVAIQTADGRTFYRGADQPETAIAFGETLEMFSLRNSEEVAKHLGTFKRALKAKDAVRADHVGTLVFEKDGRNIYVNAGAGKVANDFANPTVTIVEVYNPETMEYSVSYWLVDGREEVTNPDVISGFFGNNQ